MDVLKQLETRLRALVEQRNQLKAELDTVRKAAQGESQELASLRQRAHDLEAERDALAKEREGVRKDVEKILKLLEGAE
jgi:chromosome segregation ATPase